MKLFKKLIKKYFTPKRYTITESTDDFRIKEVFNGFILENKVNVFKFEKYPLLKEEQKFYLDWQAFSRNFETLEQAKEELDRIKRLPNYHYE